MLDGDYLGAVQPFEIYDAARVSYLYKTIVHVATLHKQHGYEDLIVNYVFETPETLADLRKRLFNLDDVTYAFRLTCSEAEMEQRIRGRTQEPDQLAWELQRFRQLTQILEASALRGGLGYPIDTCGKTARQVAREIYANIHDAVLLQPYDPTWPDQFAAEQKQIAAALGDRALAIEHIGSTSIPGLSAKPVVDILVAVKQLAEAVDCIAPLAKLGYTFIDHPQNIQRRYFRKGMPRTHHLHIVEAGRPEAVDHIAFRDALRRDPALRQQYADLKASLAERYPTNRAAYTEAKGEFIRHVLEIWRSRSDGDTTKN